MSMLVTLSVDGQRVYRATLSASTARALRQLGGDTAYRAIAQPQRVQISTAAAVRPHLYTLLFDRHLQRDGEGAERVQAFVREYLAACELWPHAVVQVY